MRLFLQASSLLILVVMGWNQPFRDLADRLLPWMGIGPSHLAVLRGRANGLVPVVPPDGAPPTPMPPPTKRPFESTSRLNLRP